MFKLTCRLPTCGLFGAQLNYQYTFCIDENSSGNPSNFIKAKSKGIKHKFKFNQFSKGTSNFQFIQNALE